MEKKLYDVTVWGEDRLSATLWLTEQEVNTFRSIWDRLVPEGRLAPSLDIIDVEAEEVAKSEAKAKEEAKTKALEESYITSTPYGTYSIASILEAEQKAKGARYIDPMSYIASILEAAPNT